MPDYFRADQLAIKLALPLEELKKFEDQGLIRGVHKSGQTFYSSHDFYKLKGLLHFVRDEGLSLKAARARLSQPGVLVSASER
jgi:DNA-binding transcriptional MerR regulator